VKAAKAKPEYRARELVRQNRRYGTDADWRAKIRARSQERYAADPEFRARVAADTKARRATPEGRAAHNASNAKRKKTPRGRMLSAFYAQRRRAAMYSANDGLSVDAWLAICGAFDCQCAYCGSSREIQMEHVVAVCAGGRHGPTNVAPACKVCNLKKNRKPVDVFLAERGLDPDVVAERFGRAMQRLGEAIAA